jgi:hypothetical protein
VDPENRAGFTPKLVKVIVFTLFLGEYVDYNFAQVQQYPAGFGIALTMIPG